MHIIQYYLQTPLNYKEKVYTYLKTEINFFSLTHASTEPCETKSNTPLNHWKQLHFVFNNNLIDWNTTNIHILYVILYPDKILTINKKRDEKNNEKTHLNTLYYTIYVYK